MPKPLRRIEASKLGAVSEYHAPQTLPVLLPQHNRTALSTHVIERPATGIVLTIACGPRAGEMIGTDEQEVMIGFSHDCLLHFSRDQYPHGTGSRLLLRHGTEGWYALRVSGDSAFVNQHQLTDKFPLRSGDMIRLSSRGPDVQFAMHSGGVAIRALVDQYLRPHSVTSAVPAALAADAAQPTTARTADQFDHASAVAPMTSIAAERVAAEDAPARDAPARDAPAADVAEADVAEADVAAADVATGRVAVPHDFSQNNWAWQQRSARMAVALGAAILLLIVVLAWLSSVWTNSM